MLYTNKFINLISLILTIVICFIIHFCFLKKNNPIEKLSNLISEIDIIKEKDEEKNNEITQETIDFGNWYIEIPAINLVAPIAEGTDINTLNSNVGHFVDTPIETGNVGLAAHNRGYKYNFFQNLKKLRKEDSIIYTHEEFKRIYIIDKIEIIENTNWNFLKESDENRITLITCVENEPKYRRCVQAVELEN
ncbi:MAG: sortase [Clostridia bacterium]|nr:sortase [Clostridia bacterium]